MRGHVDAALLDEVYTTARDLYDSYEQPHQTGVQPRCLCARCALIAAAEHLELSPAQRREAFYLLQVDAKAKYALTMADLAVSGPDTVSELYTSILLSLAQLLFAPEGDVETAIGIGSDGHARHEFAEADDVALGRQPWPRERPATLLADLPFVTAGGLAHDPARNRLYLPIDGGSALAVVDAGCGATVSVIPLGVTGESWEPTAVAINTQTQYAYVVHSSYDRGTLGVVDGANGTATAAVPLDAAPTDLAVDVAANRVYVAQHDAEQVTILDGDSLRVLGIVPFNTTVGAVRFDPATNRVYVAEDRDGVIHVLDGGGGERLARIDLAAPVFDLALDPAVARLYAVGGDLIGGAGDEDVTGFHVVDSGAHRVRRRVRTWFTPMHVAAAGPHQFCVAPANHPGIAFVDARTGGLVAAWRTPGAVVGLAAHPDARRVYALGLTSLWALEAPTRA